MGNHYIATFLGRGCVEIWFTSAKKVTLMNVLHVPDKRKNLVSANLLCKNGFKVVLESNKLILSKNSVFIGKGYSCGGMFKLSINNVMNVSAYIVEYPLFLWHERLGHINFISLKCMSNMV